MKTICLLMTLLSGLVFAQDNLLKNGTFDDKHIFSEIYSDYVKDTFTLSQHIEEMTWNRCLKAELKAFGTNKDGKRTVYLNVVFGKDGKLCGFPIRPDTVYHYELECKGSYAHGIGLKACSWHGNATSIWDKSRETIVTSVNACPLNKDWTICKGTFKTGPKADHAALIISLWGDESQQNNFNAKIGDFVLIDNVRVTPKTDILPSADEAPAPVDIVDNRDYIGLPAVITNFINAKTGKPTEKATYRADVKTDDKGVILTVDCFAKTPVKAAIHDRKTNIWRDDVVEIFFGPSPRHDRLLSQFVICAGGGRYMGRGSGEIDDYDSWQGTATVTDTGWRAMFVIPWQAIGYSSAPVPGSTLPFNVSAQHDGELASWSLVRNNFHDTEKFNIVVFGTAKDYAARLLQDIRNRPASLAAQIDALAAGTMSLKDISIGYRRLQETIKNQALGKAKFLLGRRAVTGNYTLPLDISLEDLFLDETKPIELQAAVNESISLPLTLTNRTKNVATYRIMLHPDCRPGDVETIGLNPDFPPEQIEMREAIAMKDGDNFGAAMRFDALPLMNQAYVITIPAGQTSVIWININCKNITPGTYTGAIRVTPLAEPATLEIHKYKGDMKDYKVALNVLPVTLDIDHPLKPCWLMSGGFNEEFFTQQTDLMDRYVGVSPWSFKYTFDDQGNLLNEQLPELLEAIRTRVSWFEKLNRRNGILFLVHFSAYTVFEQQYMPKTIKVMTPEWRNCWQNNLKAMHRLFSAAGVKDSEWGIEVFDEPNGKNFARDLEVCRIAHETLPTVFLTCTWAAPNFGNGIDNIRQFDKYLTSHCFWASYCTDPAFREFMKELQQRKKSYGIYFCSTSMRESLHRYFRLHPWRAWECGARDIGLYILFDAPHGKPGNTNWKIACLGGILYRSGNHCLPSIRMEAFRQGLMDSAYMSLLQHLAAQGDTPLHQEARRFLAEAPKDAIVSFAHDQAAPDRLRQKAIDLILKLQQ